MKTDKLLNIHPSKVNFALDIKINIAEEVKTIDGDWDIDFKEPLENDIVYNGLYDLLVNNKDWTDTILYKFMVKYLQRGEPKWSCTTLEKCIDRKNYILNLYNDIKKTRRILTRKEVLVSKNLKTKRPSHLPSEQIYPENDDIMVAIDRHGRFLFVKNGCHRFSISKILNFQTIPARVYQRHSEWEKFREEVFNMCKEYWKGRSYQKIPHPDFDEIKPLHTFDPYKVIKSNTELPTSSKLLDIGSLFGYICYKAELDGFNCTAVEIDKNYLKVMKKLHYANEMKFKIYEGSIFNLIDKNHDIVAAFNIFHHFLKTEGDFNRLKHFLSELEYKEMFVQFHRTDETQMQKAYKNFNEIEFCEFIIKNSKNKTSYKILGEFDGRKIAKVY